MITPHLSSADTYERDNDDGFRCVPDRKIDNQPVRSENDATNGMGGANLEGRTSNGSSKATFSGTRKHAVDATKLPTRIYDARTDRLYAESNEQN